MLTKPFKIIRYEKNSLYGHPLLSDDNNIMC